MSNDSNFTLDKVTDDDTDEEPSDDNNGSSPSVTNVRLNQRDHPDAYEALQGGGPIRNAADSFGMTTKEYVAEVIKPFGKFSDTRDRMPLLNFTSPKPGDLLRYCNEVGWAEVSKGDGEVTITLQTDDDEE
jgi:hypothetical protein